MQYGYFYFNEIFPTIAFAYNDQLLLINFIIRQNSSVVTNLFDKKSNAL
jgi:hypothetical protein